MRIGIGHDTHRLAAGRPLILGGIKIDHPLGLHGHSDADVVLHAITDALLGAAGLGDIGEAFADTDPRWKNADSSIFLKSTLERLAKAGWGAVNVDVTIFAQEPKLAPVKAAMRQRVADLLGLALDDVNIKAKTGERLGHIGRAEGIACQAVALIDRKVAKPKETAAAKPTKKPKKRLTGKAK